MIKMMEERCYFVIGVKTDLVTWLDDGIVRDGQGQLRACDDPVDKSWSTRPTTR